MTLGDFSQQTQAYGQARPTYPREMVDALLAEAGIAAGDAVADFGAGTGIFTRLLTERGLDVTALEPNEAMRSRNAAPQARWLPGTFEASGLETGSQKCGRSPRKPSIGPIRPGPCPKSAASYSQAAC